MTKKKAIYFTDRQLAGIRFMYLATDQGFGFDYGLAMRNTRKICAEVEEKIRKEQEERDER